MHTLGTSLSAAPLIISKGKNTAVCVKTKAERCLEELQWIFIITRCRVPTVRQVLEESQLEQIVVLPAEAGTQGMHTRPRWFIRFEGAHSAASCAMCYFLWDCGVAFYFFVPTREARELVEALRSREKELLKDVEIAGR